MTETFKFKSSGAALIFLLQQIPTMQETVLVNIASAQITNDLKKLGKLEVQVKALQEQIKSAKADQLLPDEEPKRPYNKKPKS